MTPLIRIHNDELPKYESALESLLMYMRSLHRVADRTQFILHSLEPRKPEPLSEFHQTVQHYFRIASFLARNELNKTELFCRMNRVMGDITHNVAYSEDMQSELVTVGTTYFDFKKRFSSKLVTKPVKTVVTFHDAFENSIKTLREIVDVLKRYDSCEVEEKPLSIALSYVECIDKHLEGEKAENGCLHI